VGVKRREAANEEEERKKEVISRRTRRRHLFDGDEGKDQLEKNKLSDAL